MDLSETSETKAPKPIGPKTPDGRNLVDKYWFWTNDQVKEDLDSKRFNYSILCCNLTGDFNKSCIVRSANVFLAQEVIMYGKKKFDKRGAVGTHHYTNFKFVKFADDDTLDKIMSEYDLIVGVDNIDGASDVNLFPWDKNIKTLICFGEEHVGIHPDILKRCHNLVYIKQYGSVRSLNVASAASIIMNSYCSKNN